MWRNFIGKLNIDIIKEIIASFEAMYSKEWLCRLAVCQSIEIKQRQGDRATFLLKAHPTFSDSLLHTAIKQNQYELLWLFVDNYGYKIDLQCDGTTLLHTVANHRLAPFNLVEMRHVARLIKLTANHDIKAGGFKRTWQEKAYVMSNANQQFFRVQVALANLEKETWQRVWLMRKKNIHRNFFWHISKYVCDAELKLWVEVDFDVLKLIQARRKN